MLKHTSYSRSRLTHKRCPHCGKHLNLKTFKEHRRLYYDSDRKLWNKYEPGGTTNSQTASSSSLLEELELVDMDIESVNSDGEQSEQYDWADDLFVDDEPPISTQLQTCLVNSPDVDEDTETGDDTPSNSPDPPSPEMFLESGADNQEEQAVVWWLVMFIGLFQALHSITDRATTWLIRFLSAVLKCLAAISQSARIQRIYSLFPASFYRFKQYLANRCGSSNITKYVVCPKCETLYTFDESVERSGVTVYTYSTKKCTHCEFGHIACGQELVRKIVSRPDHPRVYPHKVYCYTTIISTLQRFFCRPGFYDLIESTRSAYTDTIIRDIFQGQIWKDFLTYGGQPFLLAPLCYAMVLNIDWFEAYENYKYKVGVIYLALLNLPRNIRYKRENIILVGIIPGPSEPSIHINTYLAPLVNELLDLWKGVTLNIGGIQKLIRVALLCVACDTPAARKVSGFVSHSANLGCPRCYCAFSEGGLARNRSNFDRSTWEYRTNAKHRDNVQKLFTYTTKTVRAEQELKLGCRYSALLNLPYFDPVRMTIIDGMHNIFLGSANYFIRKILIPTNVLDKRKLQIIHNRMKQLQLPYDIGRLPSGFESGATFTAEQWMNWTLYFSVFCFYGLISDRQLECWRHLVLASRRLCKRSLRMIDITVSDLLLLRFGKQVCELFGYRFVTPNMHMHCHLAECLKDYGPLHAFWLFSFERYNGLLGKQPTNNHAIELQLLNRFNNDNLRLDLLHHAESMPLANYFSEVTVDYATSFNSIKPTQLLPDSQEVANFMEPSKHSLFVLSDSLLTDLKSMYAKLLPDYATQIENGSMELVSTCKKYLHIFMNGKKLACTEQEVPYVLATSLEDSSNPRPFRIDYFVKHSVLIPMSEVSTTHLFAVGRWPQKHPNQHLMGKPVELWCLSVFESSFNCFVPVSSIHGRTIVATQSINDENVLVIIPLLD